MQRYPNVSFTARTIAREHTVCKSLKYRIYPRSRLQLRAWANIMKNTFID
jgi:hypothetical protein